MTLEPKQFKLLPPPPHLCQQCAYDHAPDQPHNLTLFYRYWFWYQHGRWPSWADAMAHCDEETKEAWQVQLRDRGVWQD